MSERLAGSGAGARRPAALVALAGIALYSLLVGAEASVVRAAIMAGLALVARLLGRQSYAPVALLVAAMLMTAVNPLTLWDAGFQLSFMATLGLILYSEPITAALLRLLGRITALAGEKPMAGFVGEYFGVTLAAQITTLPLIVYYFRRLSLVSLVANGLVLPAQPAVMILGGLAMLAWRPLGAVLAWAAWPFVTFTIAVVEWLARAPATSLDLGRVSLGAAVGLYAVLFGLTWWAGHTPPAAEGSDADAPPPGFLKRQGTNVLLGLLAVGVALTWSGVFALPDGKLHVTVLDVGQGPAVLVQTPSGKRVLLGGGPSGNRLADGLGRRLSLWNRRLALVVVPGPADDQVAGLAAELPHHAVDQVVTNSSRSRHTAAYRELMDGLNRRAVPIIRAEAGQEFDLGDGARLKVLSVGDTGIILRLVWGNASFLLPMGQAADQLTALAASGEHLASTVLLVPAGGDAALDRGLVPTISPWAVVISVGSDEPAAEALDALAGYTVLRTGQRGWVSFATDGQQLWTETER